MTRDTIISPERFTEGRNNRIDTAIQGAIVKVQDALQNGESRAEVNADQTLPCVVKSVLETYRKVGWDKDQKHGGPYVKFMMKENHHDRGYFIFMTPEIRQDKIEASEFGSGSLMGDFSEDPHTW